MRYTGLASVALLGIALAHSGAQRTHAGAEQLGAVHFQTSCARAYRRRFDRAVALLHSFEFGASIRGFNDVLAADSTCAMAHWGIALSRWTNPMAPGTRAPRSAATGPTSGRRRAASQSARDRA